MIKSYKYRVRVGVEQSFPFPKNALVIAFDTDAAGAGSARAFFAMLKAKGYPHGRKLGHGKVIASIEQVEIT